MVAGMGKRVQFANDVQSHSLKNHDIVTIINDMCNVAATDILR